MAGTYNPESGLGRFLGGIFGGTPRGGKETPEAAPPATPEVDPLDPLHGRAGQVELAQERDIEALTRAEEARLMEARGADYDIKQRQAEAEAGFGRAETATVEGLEEVQGTIEDTRSTIKDIPEQVRGEFDRQRVGFQQQLTRAEGMVGVQRDEALSNVMEGRASAMDAAVQTMHGEVNRAVANIDRMVQMGQLSPAQAQSMKMQARMSGAMAIAPAIGTTVHQFTQTQALVATEFGNMLTSIETTGLQVGGALGVAAGQAFATSSQFVGEMNVRLTELDSQATSQRNATLATLSADRAAAFNMNDQTRVTMLDHLAESVVLTSPAAHNNYMVTQDIVNTEIKMGHMDEYMDIMRENIEMSNKMATTNMWLGIGQSLLGLIV
jgi:hypothetical protein